MAHTLRLDVVAEGVETPDQLRILQLYRCDAVQGHLAGRPIPAEALLQRMSDGEISQLPAVERVGFGRSGRAEL